MAVSVSVNGGGDAVIYQTSTGVYFDLLDSSLIPVKLDDRVAGASSWVDAQTRAAGGFTVEWLSGGVIMAEDFSATGAALDSAYAYSGTPSLAPLGFSSHAAGSTAVLLGGDLVTASLTSASGHQTLTIQQHDANGAADAPAFTLTAPPISGYAAPVIAPLADGGYVAEYALNGNYAASLYAERFSSAGAPLGEVSLAHYGGLVSLSPSTYSIAGLADGGFVAAWTVSSDIMGSGQQAGTYAEEFTASGTGLGVVHLGDAATGAPSIDALSDGRYGIAWTTTAGAAEHASFTEAGASLGQTDPVPPPTTSTGASTSTGAPPNLLHDQTWAALMDRIGEAMPRSLDHTLGSALSSIAALTAALSDLPGAANPAASGGTTISDPVSSVFPHISMHGHDLFLV